jgi:hypothetical protein
MPPGWVLEDLLTWNIKQRRIKRTILGILALSNSKDQGPDQYQIIGSISNNRIRIRINVKSQIRIRIKVKSRIRIQIRIKMVLIRNTGCGVPAIF